LRKKPTWRRGFVVTDGARGTSVASVPPARVTRVSQLPAGVRDLSSGNPDPHLLPSLAAVFTRLEPSHKLYGVAAKLPELESLAAETFAAAAFAATSPSPVARWTRSNVPCKPSFAQETTSSSKIRAGHGSPISCARSA
jgi:hypothetical protein